MNVQALFNAFAIAIALRDASKRFKGAPSADAPTDSPADPPAAPHADAGMSHRSSAQGVTGRIEARLTNVVVAALKEAFDRDHARVKLERAHLDEQGRRAETALRLELCRQAADRETGRLRLIAGMALGGWIASVVVLGTRLGDTSDAARAAVALGWLLLLGALGAALAAQRRVGAFEPDAERPITAGAAGVSSLWLLMAGLAATAASLLV